MAAMQAAATLVGGGGRGPELGEEEKR